MTLIPFLASSLRDSPNILCISSLKPGTELAFSLRNRCVRSGSVPAGRRFEIVLAADAYSDGERQRLLFEKVEET